MRELAADLFGRGLTDQVVDQRMLDGRQPTAHLLAALEQRELFARGQRVAVVCDEIVEGSVDGVKSCRQRLSIDTHSPNLAGPTDKNGPLETVET
jgi:hypothetical protein